MHLFSDGTRPACAMIEHASECVALPLGMVYIGRGAGCFLRIDDPAISRVHLALEVADEVVVHDLGSRNGAKVNGERLLAARTLADGDVIAIGDRTLRLHILEADPEGLDEETPALRTGTLAGIGAVRLDQQCPSCKAEISIALRHCPHCGHRWRRASPGRTTEADNEKVVAQPEERPDERRVHPRYQLRPFSASYRGVQELECTVRDISRGGVFIACDAVDAAGSPCEIDLFPPSLEPQMFRGRVCRVVRQGEEINGMGIQFDTVVEQQVRWLAQLLLKQLRHAAD